MQRARFEDIFPPACRLFACPGRTGPQAGPNRKFGPSGMTGHKSFAELQAAMLQIDKTGQAWNGVAGYLPNAQAANRNTVKLLKAFWQDVDIKEGSAKHHGSKAEALKAISNFFSGHDVPYPNIIVDSGNGLHLYWALSVPILPDKWLEATIEFREFLKLDKLGADTSRVADMVSVMRFPGTHNRKNEPKLISELPFNPVYTTYGLFDPAGLADTFRRVGNLGRANRKVNRSGSHKIEFGDEFFINDPDYEAMIANLEAAAYPALTPEKVKLVLDTASELDPGWREHFNEETEITTNGASQLIRYGRYRMAAAVFNACSGADWGFEVLENWLLETEGAAGANAREERNWRLRRWRDLRAHEEMMETRGFPLYSFGTVIAKILSDNKKVGERLVQMLEGKGQEAARLKLKVIKPRPRARDLNSI